MLPLNFDVVNNPQIGTTWDNSLLNINYVLLAGQKVSWWYVVSTSFFRKTKWLALHDNCECQRGSMRTLKHEKPTALSQQIVGYCRSFLESFCGWIWKVTPNLRNSWRIARPFFFLVSIAGSRHGCGPRMQEITAQRKNYWPSVTVQSLIFKNLAGQHGLLYLQVDLGSLVIFVSWAASCPPTGMAAMFTFCSSASGCMACLAKVRQWAADQWQLRGCTGCFQTFVEASLPWLGLWTGWLNKKNDSTNNICGFAWIYWQKQCEIWVPENRVCPYSGI